MIKAKKSLGQHFLTSTRAIADIIAAARIQPGEIILEIGPGTGILTKALLEAGAHVVAVEKDARVIETLREGFSSALKEGSFDLLEGDILEPAVLDGLDREHGLNKKGYALVANIPYYITGAILQKFLEEEPRPDRMVLLVQKEVAERIVARDGKESVLSISVKAFGEPRIVSTVPRGSFVPPPSVDSAIISIENVSAEAFDGSMGKIRRFFDLVRAGFAHKRKFVRKNLEEVLSPEEIHTIWERLNLDPKARAEDFSVATWKEIAK